ncbi:hypothetical protein [uncultured Marinobacter sp.]|uniref:hypothetical protein n=1 Tax=uncultured Marinobacter sp. TaxID=187379 RepID=UPI002589349E|nr:hypothetical protein [uncultured Marinobacter sp.]
MKNNLLWILGFIVALMLLSFLGWGWMYLTAEIKGRAEAERQIESAPSRIANYEHFYDLCATIQGNEAALAAQRAAMATAPADEQARYRANIAGIHAQRQRNIARYNQDASKSYTRARFLGEDLPRRLDPNQEYTVCAN